MKLPLYKKEQKTDKEIIIQFNWLWVWWQRLKLYFISRRDPIFPTNIHVGTILKVFPKYGSHSRIPYKVKIIGYVD